MHDLETLVYYYSTMTAINTMPYELQKTRNPQPLCGVQSPKQPKPPNCPTLKLRSDRPATTHSTLLLCTQLSFQIDHPDRTEIDHLSQSSRTPVATSMPLKPGHLSLHTESPSPLQVISYEANCCWHYHEVSSVIS